MQRSTSLMTVGVCAVILAGCGESGNSGKRFSGPTHEENVAGKELTENASEKAQDDVAAATELGSTGATARAVEPTAHDSEESGGMLRSFEGFAAKKKAEITAQDLTGRPTKYRDFSTDVRKAHSPDSPYTGVLTCTATVEQTDQWNSRYEIDMAMERRYDYKDGEWVFANGQLTVTGHNVITYGNIDPSVVDEGLEKLAGTKQQFTEESTSAPAHAEDGSSEEIAEKASEEVTTFRNIRCVDGRTMQGKFVPFPNGDVIKSGMVRIERSDGKVFDYPVAKLSQEDQDFARQQGGRTCEYPRQWWVC